MSGLQLYNVILAPHVSEKSTRVADAHRQYVFRVADFATKPMVKKAVEQMFDVKVDTVQLAVVRGKMKYGRTPGKRRNWKKAFVRLQEGHDIDFLGGA